MVLFLLSWPCEVNEITSKQDLKQKKSRVSLLTKIVLFEIKHFPSGRIPFFPSLVKFFSPLLHKKARNGRQFQSWWVQILEHPSQIPSLGPSEMAEPPFSMMNNYSGTIRHLKDGKVNWHVLPYVSSPVCFFWDRPTQLTFFCWEGISCCWIWLTMVKSLVSGRILWNSKVSMAHVGERLELERAFSGATVHDMPGSKIFDVCILGMETEGTPTSLGKKKTWKVFLVFQIVCSGLVLK